MNTPNVSLMRAYGTDAAFKEKTANVAPIAQRMADIILGRGLLEQRIQGQNHTARHTMQAEMMNTAFRVLELARLEHAIDNANHTQAPIILPHNYGQDMPLGMTEGMIRMASAAAETLAKEAALPMGASSVYRTQAVRPPVPDPSSGKISLKPAAAAAAAPVAAAAAPAGPDIAQRASALWHRTGLSNGRATPKLMALGAAGALTLGGLAALKKVKSYMEEETPARPYRNGGNQLSPDINEHGHAQPTIPNY